MTGLERKISEFYQLNDRQRQRLSELSFIECFELNEALRECDFLKTDAILNKLNEAPVDPSRKNSDRKSNWKQGKLDTHDEWNQKKAEFGAKWKKQVDQFKNSAVGKAATELVDFAGELGDTVKKNFSKGAGIGKDSSPTALKGLAKGTSKRSTTPKKKPIGSNYKFDSRDKDFAKKAKEELKRYDSSEFAEIEGLRVRDVRNMSRKAHNLDSDLRDKLKGLDDYKDDAFINKNHRHLTAGELNQILGEEQMNEQDNKTLDQMELHELEKMLRHAGLNETTCAGAVAACMPAGKSGARSRNSMADGFGPGFGTAEDNQQVVKRIEVAHNSHREGGGGKIDYGVPKPKVKRKRKSAVKKGTKKK